MKLICPSCGAVHSAEAWQNDPVARQCLAMVGEMPHDVGSRCFAYLALFRPAGRSLQWKKVLRLLSELKDLAGMSHIQWDKSVARPNSARAWGLAMERMIEHPPKRLPLKSHGYLRSVAYEITDEMDKQREVQKNKDERRGKRQTPTSNVEHRTSNGTAALERISGKEMREIRKRNYRKR